MSEDTQLPVAGERNVTTANDGEQEHLECDQNTLRTSDFYRTKNLPERFDKPGQYLIPGTTNSNYKSTVYLYIMLFAFNYVLYFDYTYEVLYVSAGLIHHSSDG